MGDTTLSSHQSQHERVLLDYFDGDLRERAVADAVYLLETCAECRSLYRQDQRLRATLKGSGALAGFLAEEEKEKRLWQLPPQWAVAAALFFLVLSVVTLYHYSKLVQSRDQELAKDKKKLVGLAEALDRQAGQVQSLQQKLEQAERPYANSFSYILHAFNLRSAPREQAIELPPEAAILNLILGFEDPSSPRYYRVSLRAPNGTVIWAGDGLVRDQYGRLQIGIPRAFLLKNPDMTLSIFGLEGGREKLIAEDVLKIKV